MLSTPAIIGSKSKVTAPALPDPPTGLTLTNLGDQGEGAEDYSVQLDWNAVAGATKYEFQFNINSGGYSAAYDNGTDLQAVINAMTQGNDVCAKVRVTTSAGTSDWSAGNCINVGDPI